MSHLECVSSAGIEAMAAAEVVGVLLPTTAYILRLNPPPARKMMDAGESTHTAFLTGLFGLLMTCICTGCFTRSFHVSGSYFRAAAYNSYLWFE